MIRNYLLVAIRSALRHTTYSIISVLGLALGMSCALLIFSIVSHHLSYDKDYTDRDRIYRIVTEQHRDQVSYTSGVPSALGKAVREDFTYTEKIARIATYYEGVVSVMENGDTKKFVQPAIAIAENDFFEIISRPLVDGGKPSEVLINPNDAVITESAARKIFGDANPVDRVFKIDNKAEFRVAGVIKDIPNNTDIRQEIFVSYEGLKFLNEYLAEGTWSGISGQMQCYAKLKPGTDVGEMEEAMFGYVKKFRPNSKNIHHYKLQPLSEVHFDPRYGAAMNMRTIIALAIIGFFLVITACVNFVNMATARATSRAREVGVRKVLGGVRPQIFRQFMSETFVITLSSVVIAVVIVSSVIPSFNFWFNSRFSLDLLDWRPMVFIPALLFFVTFVAGFYPGLILSAFQPSQALKGKLAQTGGLNLRRALIVAQFSISQVLIIVLIVVIYQVHYSQTTEMGFDREAVVMIPIGQQGEKAKTMKAEFQNIPGVESVSLCWSAPSTNASWSASVVFGNRDEDENFSVRARMGDENFLPLFDIELVAGRNLVPSDTVREFLVNEMFARKLGLPNEAVVGETIKINDWQVPIVGVVRDFHTSSFHEDISPIFIGSESPMYNEYAVKINMNGAAEILPALKKRWEEAFPEQIYTANFVDEQIEGFYEAENTVLKLVEVFSFVAILVGCLGLFGLVSFMAIQRTKEIGIRKVLGGSVADILWTFGKEFSLLIFAAFAIAAPAGWWLMNKWLEDYEFHIALDAWIFVASISATFIVAVLTVGYRSVKAATANPVDSLRTE
jgi:putative ABC transport system permease protein